MKKTLKSKLPKDETLRAIILELRKAKKLQAQLLKTINNDTK